MLRTAWLWRSVGPLTLMLSGLSLIAASATAAEPPPSRQLTDLGRQALSQGHADEARTFFRKALELDPKNAEARRGLDSSTVVRRVAFQPPAGDVAPPADPALALPPAPVPAVGVDPDAKATLERSAQLEAVQRQQLTDDVGQRLQEARTLVNSGQPEAEKEPADLRV